MAPKPHPLERALRAASLEERERCAKVVEMFGSTHSMAISPRTFATAIRKGE
jgi:hypothetical protein